MFVAKVARGGIAYGKLTDGDVVLRINGQLVEGLQAREVP